MCRRRARRRRPRPRARRTDLTRAAPGVLHESRYRNDGDDMTLMNTYPPQPVTFVRGRGTELWDVDGKRYLDFLCGLAVTSLGHSHPVVADAIAEQARTLQHVSNLYGTIIGPEVAATIDRLVGTVAGGAGRGGGGKVFFANSGAEANECALKLARKWGGRGKYGVISAFGSFHG